MSRLLAGALTFSLGLLGAAPVASAASHPVAAARVSTATKAVVPAKPLVAAVSVAPAKSAAAASTPPVVSDVGSVPLLTQVAAKPVEVLSKRTADSTTWANADGSFTSEVFAGPVRMRDATDPSGWVDLDPTLVRAADGSVAPRVHPEFLKLSGPVASAAGTTALITVADPGDPLSAATRTRSGARGLSWGWLGKLPAPVLEGTKATYPDVKPGMDLVVEATTTGFEQYLVLKVRPTDPAIASMSLPVATRGLKLVADGLGGATISDVKGVARGRMPAPVMWDAKTVLGADIPADQKPVAMTLTQATTASASVALTPDAAYLMDPATVYPVTIDPSSTLSATFDTFVQSDVTSTDYSGSTELRAGTFDGGTTKARSFLTFPLPFKGATVSAATFNIYNNYSYTCTAEPLDVHVASGANSATRWANQPYINAALYSRVTASKGYNSGCAAGTLTFDVKALAQYWANTTGSVQAYAIQAGSETNSWGWKKFNSTNASSGRPSLTVTYNRPPNTPGTPTHTPGTSSNTTTAGWTSTLTPTLKATVSDPDGGNVQGQFSVYLNGTGTPVVNKAVGSSVASGGTSTYTVPTGKLVNGSSYVVRAYGWDGSLTSAAWSTGYDRFVVDTTAPNAPVVTSTTWTAGSWTPATSGTFTWSDTSPDVSSYSWKLDSGAWSTFGAATSHALSALTPNVEHTFSVKGNDASGHTSAVTDFTFGVGVQCASSGSRAASQPLTHQLSDTTAMSLNPINGNLLLTGSLLHLRGVGQDLNIGWRYNALVDTRPTLSTGLTETALQPWSDGSFSYAAPDGGCYTFTKTGTTWKTPAGINATMTSPAAGTMALRFNPSGIINTYLNTAGVYQLTQSADKTIAADNPNLTQYFYTAGKLTQITDTQGRHVTFAYTDVNNPTQPSTITDTSLSRTIALAYGGPTGALSQITDATGAITTLGYDTTGLVSVTNNGNQTTFGYDTGQRLTSWAFGTGNAEESDWAATYDSSTSTTITDGNGNAAKYTIAGPWVTHVIDPSGVDITSSWDASNDLTARSDIMGNLTNTKYDPLTNMMSEITSPASGGGGVGSAVSLTFPTDPSDPQGAYPQGNYQPSTTKDAQGNTSSIGYDVKTFQPNLVTSKDASGAAVGGTKTTTIQGDSAGTNCAAKSGEVCTTSNGNNNTTSYGYDALGNPTSITPPGPLTKRDLTYDPAGRVLSATDGRGNTTYYTYDANGRTTQVAHTATGCPAATCVSYTYDDAGNLTSRTSPTGLTSIGYDGLNRPITKTQAGDRVSTATYDPASNLTSYTDTNGTIAYGYNNANRLISLAEPGGSCPIGVTTPNTTACTVFTYDFSHHKTATSFPNGQTTTTVYDTAGRVASITAKTADGITTLASRAYTYQSAPVTLDDQALLASMTDQSGTTSYLYDGLNRLTKATEGATVSSWEYDNDGNRTTAATTGTPTVYSAYNGADQLCWTSTTNATGCATPPTGATNYTYDASGNQTSDQIGTTTLGNTFNVFNQLTDTLIGGTTTLTSTYADTSNTERISAGATSFINGTLGLTSETTSGIPINYIRDPNGNLIAMHTSDQSYYYTTDKQGSVIALTDNTQALVATYTYDPWGNTTTSTGALATTNAWRYATGYTDAATGYLKLGARYYNPTTARFTQPDPAHTCGGYTYAEDNPTNNTDSTGRCSASDVTHGLMAGGLMVADAEGSVMVATMSLDPVIPIVLGGILGVFAGFGYLYCALS